MPTGLSFLCAPLADKRIRLVVGVKAARGSILALVDDDVYWRAEGGCRGQRGCRHTKVQSPEPVSYPALTQWKIDRGNSAEIPPERQSSRVITAWEATSTFDLCQWKGSREVHFAADGGRWCLSARTLLIRTSILQDPSFIKAYTHEVIGRRVVNTADDVVLTGWVLIADGKCLFRMFPRPRLPPTSHRITGLPGRFFARTGATFAPFWGTSSCTLDTEE